MEGGASNNAHGLLELQFSPRTAGLLWFSNFFGTWICFRWKNQKSMMKIYADGCEKVDRSLDALRVTKQIEYMKQTLESTTMTLDKKREIMQSDKLVI